MKRAVSISLGATARNKTVTVALLGAEIVLERLGTDGDQARAAQLYAELDGQVAAFGVGGIDLGLQVADRFYPLYAAQRLVRAVRHTPVVDGGGLKNTLEWQAAPFLAQQLGAALGAQGTKRVFITSGVDRWGMAEAFVRAGYECVFGDLMFALGLPWPLRSLTALKRLAAVLMPIVGRLPFEWVYPTGEKQSTSVPKFTEWYHWADVIAGDGHYINRHLPPTLPGKIICTNTTTPADVQRYRAAGVKHLVTTTPVFEGRTFGTNLLEAGLVAASGKNRPLTFAELEALIAQLNLTPTLQTLT